MKGNMLFLLLITSYKKIMTFHEFGKENTKKILMLHPLAVDWNVFQYVYPTLALNYHVIIPAIPGMDPDDINSEFSSVEEIADEIESFLLNKEIKKLACLYGCSMGGGIAIRILADNRIQSEHIVIDAGITPYQMPKIVCFLIAIGDFLMLMLGKVCSVKMLGYMFDPEKYSKEDLMYVKSVISRMSTKTIWRAFWSTDNYSMPKYVEQPEAPIYYWYGEQEKRARNLDMQYVKSTFLNVKFIEHKGQGHSEYFTLHPKEFCEDLMGIISDLN